MDKHEHRRLRLLELKKWKCDDKIARLAERIARSDSYVARMLYEEGKAGKKRIGDDMLDVLEAAFTLRHGWFDLPLGTPATSETVGQLVGVAETGESSAANMHTLKRAPIRWPFFTVTYQRVMDLKTALGPKDGVAAMRDIDALLDVAVTKWERQGNPTKRQHR